MAFISPPRPESASGQLHRGRISCGFLLALFRVGHVSGVPVFAGFVGEALINKAVKAMYYAKRMGRNRIEFYQEITDDKDGIL